MERKKSTFKNMVASLFLVTFFAAIILSTVYNFTEEPISKAKLIKKIKAIETVLPVFTNNPTSGKYTKLSEDDRLTLEFYPVKVDNKHVATAIKTYTKQGYNGLIWLMVGFLIDGSIYNISVLEHKETPGLGDKMSKPHFIKQFIKKNPKKNNLTVKKDGGEIDAITAATITSRAFCDAIQRAYQLYDTTKIQP